MVLSEFVYTIAGCTLFGLVAVGVFFCFDKGSINRFMAMVIGLVFCLAMAPTSYAFTGRPSLFYIASSLVGAAVFAVLTNKSRFRSFQHKTSLSKADPAGAAATPQGPPPAKEEETVTIVIRAVTIQQGTKITTVKAKPENTPPPVQAEQPKKPQSQWEVT